ncbi:MAG: fused MFS/spermidine synthase [Saprospiraceae bacterium]|nr:fused MFS/spermidine synthase [Saprospiraceae bacterium]
MIQPWHKRLLSHFKEVHILSTGSDYNEVLDLYLVKGRYQLCTEKAIYSYGDKYDNFANVFNNISLNKINDVLILGLGLASIPIILEKIHQKRFTYTGVEIDDEVVYLASKYVLDELISDVQVYTTDAYSFMCLNENKYDLICMDVFVDDTIPAELETIEYLEMMRDALAKDGMLIYNRLAFTPEDKKDTAAFFQEAFAKVFPDARIFVTGGNRMLVNK